MKIHWSSTFAMLQRALELKEVCMYNLFSFNIPSTNKYQEVNLFIERLAWQERQDSIKSCKLLDLQLAEAELDQVWLILALLVVRAIFQVLLFVWCSLVIFSMLRMPSTHSPVSMNPHSTLQYQHLKPFSRHGQHAPSEKKYSAFGKALEAGLAKVSDYYDCTSTSDAHMIAMSE